nr:PREDICTED: uncharacterized protein C11orf74 homolog isoform X2 [Lepisosteus oculatus]
MFCSLDMVFTKDCRISVVLRSLIFSMDLEQIIQETLDLFCSSSEQTYQEFLGSFTHLSPGSNELTSVSDEVHQAAHVSSEDEDEKATPDVRTRTPPCHAERLEDKEEFVLDAGVRMGSVHSGELSLAGKLKLDNYLESVHLSSDEESDLTIGTAQGTLPGEAEEEVPSYVPSFLRHTQLKCRTGKQQLQGSSSKCEVVTEVVPFSLDENFDYDYVVLSHKFLQPEAPAHGPR